MNIIHKAIINRKYIGKNRGAFEKSKWSEFKKDVKGKKLFLFGGTSACDFFLNKYGDKFAILAVLDNDKTKNGKKYSNYTKQQLPPEYKGLLIKSPEELKKYKPDEIAVIIASTNYYEEIAEQLEHSAIFCYYILLLMEARLPKYTIYKIIGNWRCFKNKYVSPQIRRNQADREDMRRFRCYAKEPIQQNKIVFRTFGKYMDHGKYIAEEILRQRLPYDLVWLVDNEDDVSAPTGIRLVTIKNRDAMSRELVTAKMWISDVELPYAVRKRKGQFYIQTKHWAGVTLKKFYLDAPTILSDTAKVKNWKKDFRMIDCMITGSDFDTETCRRGFNFKKEVWQIGSPRTDVIFHSEAVKEKVYDYCNCSPDIKLLLYAPTYRFEQKEGRNIPEVRAIDLNYEMLLHTLKMKFGGEWRILLRLHPAVAKFSRDMELVQGVIDVSDYNDVQELVAVSEIMISDYSSVMFETAFIKKPVFLFTTDYQDYIKKEYDLLIEISSLPFPRAESNEELSRLIMSFDDKAYRESVGSFLKSYGVKEDGNASKRAVENIKRLMEA